MAFTQPNLADDHDSLPRMPPWVTSAPAETLEDVAFLSGAALATLHLVVGRADVPHALLRARLALHAAEVCVGFAGRIEAVGALRDELCLLRPGDVPGPAGTVALQWQRAVRHKFSVATLVKALPVPLADHIPVWLDVGQGGRLEKDGLAGCLTPVGQAARVLEVVLAEFPREEAAALIMADAVLARALGWDHIVPVFAAGLKRRYLRAGGDELRLACHKAVVTQATEAVRMAHDLARRAARLRMVVPKLRAKAAGEAVELFLTNDALSPSAALTSLMSDRAARRLCDRLVELGVVRELTGRPTFRLYGV